MTDFNLAGVLKGHNGWVTSIATPASSAEAQDMIVSGSRGKFFILFSFFIQFLNKIID